MDTEAELETHIGDNVLTVGENITLLNNDAGYITKALQVSNIKDERVVEKVGAFPGKWDNISFSYDLPAGAVPICANGEAWVWNWWDGWYYRLDADSYNIYPSFYGEGEVLFRCYYSLDLLQWPMAGEVKFKFYYSYIKP